MQRVTGKCWGQSWGIWGRWGQGRGGATDLAGPLGCTEGLYLRAVGGGSLKGLKRETHSGSHFKSNTDNKKLRVGGA